MEKDLQHGSRSTYMNHRCRCKPCTKAASDYSKKWNKNNPASAKASQDKWNKSNPDKIKAKRDKYRAANPEKTREQFLSWKANNPDKYKANKQKQHYRKLKVNHGCVNYNSINQLILLNNNSCVYCGGPYEHIDHIFPISKGGMNCVENITTACAKCNMSKGPKLLENWLTDTIDIKTLKCNLGDNTHG